MKVAVGSIGSFYTQYSDYHIMRDIVPSAFWSEDMR